MSQINYLIVEQQLQPPENLPEILKGLSQQFQLDIYQCRQRLTGRGLSLLTKGEPESLEKISLFLKETDYTHWLVKPTKSGFVPLKIRNLLISSDHIIFGCQKKEVIFPKGATILAVFAETSGELAEKSISQLLSSHAYRGKDDIRQLGDQKIHKVILQGKPVLDLYLLSDQREVKDAVRIFPGKFDPKGLGGRATLSSKQNLEQILNLAREYAGEFHLYTDFGLVNLPGCMLRRDNLENPETQRLNLLSLARYGWLMVDLIQAGSITRGQSPEKPNLDGAVATAILLQNPALATAGQLDEILPIAKELSTEINATATPQQSAGNTPDTADLGLPAPPPAKTGVVWSKPGFWFGSGGAVLAAIFIFLFDANNEMLNRFTYTSFATGAIPLLIAILLFWNAFYFLRMKRQIENTPTSKVRSIAMGMVEIKGEAVRKYALLSPMSNTPCVYYRLTKYRRRRNNQWQVSSVSSSDNVPFMLEDETGRVEINPLGCRVGTGSKQEGTPGQVGLMQSASGRDDKWVEELVIDGTLLYVLGYASIKRATGPTLTEKKIEALRELKKDPQNLQQFDHDGDGKISGEEWDTARAAVEEKVIRESLQNQQRKKQEEQIVIGKKKGFPLIITETHSEDRLTARYSYYTIPLFITGTIATVGAIYLLLNYLQ